MYVVKTEVQDLSAAVFTLNDQKTMYGGKHIAPGDEVFVFASENEGGPGLIARAVVLSAAPTSKVPGLDRQTPRVSITAQRTGTAQRLLGRDQLKSFQNWRDGQPETELNFKLYRQATNKIVGVSAVTAAFLRRCF